MITTMSLKQFIAICLLGHHRKGHSRPFLRIEPVSPGSTPTTSPGSTLTSVTNSDRPLTQTSTFRVLIEDSILLSGVSLISHDDEFPAADARKRNNKTCVFGCVEQVEIDGRVVKVRQHISSQT